MPSSSFFGSSSMPSQRNHKMFKLKSCTTSPQKEKPKPNVSHPRFKKVHSKSKKKLDPHENSDSSSSSTQSNTNTPSPPASPLSRSTSRADKLVKGVTQLIEGDSSIGIVETIFRSGWPKEIGLTVQKVLKVNHSESVLNKFEEFRNKVCRMIRSSFTVEDAPELVHENSWKAHEKVTNDYVAKRVCKEGYHLCQVIAVRGGGYHRHELMDIGEDGRFDSVVASNGVDSNGSEKLMVLNPRAVLPCFVVIYEVNCLP
ncbi:hypothetical protein SO802_031570 [Lithocarpus litseifolius]|uniref:Uncharacterized protein n=1 Tax=Lithocarpus litseifolius TaxID=425828 RepID=A0AAW2BKV6_9ROSI